MAGEAAFTDALLESLEEQTRGALRRTLESGTLPEGFEPMTPEEGDALTHVFFDVHGPALADATVAFAHSVLHTARGSARRPEEFQAAIKGLSAEQLTVLAEKDAADASAAVEDIESRRRAVIEALAGTGMALFRGALATGLNLLLPGAGGAALGSWTGADRRRGPSPGPVPEADARRGGRERRRVPDPPNTEPAAELAPETPTVGHPIDQPPAEEIRSRRGTVDPAAEDAAADAERDSEPESEPEPAP